MCRSRPCSLATVVLLPREGIPIFSLVGAPQSGIPLGRARGRPRARQAIAWRQGWRRPSPWHCAPVGLPASRPACSRVGTHRQARQAGRASCRAASTARGNDKESAPRAGPCNYIVQVSIRKSRITSTIQECSLFPRLGTTSSCGRIMRTAIGEFVSSCGVAPSGTAVRTRGG